MSIEKIGTFFVLKNEMNFIEKRYVRFPNMVLTGKLTWNKLIIVKGKVKTMNRDIRRTMPLLPISIVMQLTDLTARQIRYYEEHTLIEPARTEGNRRMFSLNDVDTLLEIKDLLDQGINMAGIKKVFALKNEPVIQQAKAEITDVDLRRILREEMLQAQRMQRTSIRQGDLSRFFQ